MDEIIAITAGIVIIFLLIMFVFFVKDKGLGSKDGH
jgi:hypothetical protein